MRHGNLIHTFHYKDQFLHLYMMKQHVYTNCLHSLAFVCKLNFQISECSSITEQNFDVLGNICLFKKTNTFESVNKSY
jgi:hypothetical protein